MGSGTGKPIKKRDHTSINCRDPADVPGLDRRTLGRWRAWWRSTVTDSPFAPVAMAAVVPPIDIAALPVSLLERFAGDLEERLLSLLCFLGPLTGGASAMRAF
jgi:hypothetical protein